MAEEDDVVISHLGLIATFELMVDRAMARVEKEQGVVVELETVVEIVPAVETENPLKRAAAV